MSGNWFNLDIRTKRKPENKNIQFEKYNKKKNLESKLYNFNNKTKKEPGK